LDCDGTLKQQTDLSSLPAADGFDQTRVGGCQMASLRVPVVAATGHHNGEYRLSVAAYAGTAQSNKSATSISRGYYQPVGAKPIMEIGDHNICLWTGGGARHSFGRLKLLV
jgi:hypothetical protein